MTELGSLEDQITTLFLRKLHLEVPSSDTDLVEMGILDSLALVDLLLSLEQELGADINMDDIEIDNFRSVTKIAQYVSSRQSDVAQRSEVLTRPEGVAA